MIFSPLQTGLVFEAFFVGRVNQAVLICDRSSICGTVALTIPERSDQQA